MVCAALSTPDAVVAAAVIEFVVAVFRDGMSHWPLIIVIVAHRGAGSPPRLEGPVAQRWLAVPARNARRVNRDGGLARGHAVPRPDA